MYLFYCQMHQCEAINSAYSNVIYTHAYKT